MKTLIAAVVATLFAGAAFAQAPAAQAVTTSPVPATKAEVRTEAKVEKAEAKADAAKVVERLKAHPMKLAPFTTEEFSTHSQLHWLFKTKAGIALGLAALLGLMVGAVVTSTTLHSATSASLKEWPGA